MSVFFDFEDLELLQSLLDRGAEQGRLLRVDLLLVQRGQVVFQHFDGGVGLADADLLLGLALHVEAVLAELLELDLPHGLGRLEQARPGVVGGAGVAGVRVVRRVAGRRLQRGGGFVGADAGAVGRRQLHLVGLHHARLPHQLAPAGFPRRVQPPHVDGGEQAAGAGVLTAVESGVGGVEGLLVLTALLGELLGVDGAEQALGLLVQVVRPGADLLGDLAGGGGRAAAQFAAGHVQLGHPFRRRPLGARPGRRHGRGRRRLLEDDGAPLAHPAQLRLDGLGILAEAGRQLAGLEQLLLGLGAALERVAFAAVDRLRGVVHQPVDLAVGEEGALLHRVVRRLFVGAERRMKLDRFHGLLMGFQELVFTLQPADLGQQLVRPRPVRVGGGTDERRLARPDGHPRHRRQRRSWRAGLRRRRRAGQRRSWRAGLRRSWRAGLRQRPELRLVDGDVDVARLRRGLDGRMLVLGLGLHGDGRRRRLCRHALVLEAGLLDVGQHRLRPIAEVPGAVAPVQLLGAESGALGLFVMALLHQPAGVRQQLDRLFLVLLLAGGRHVLAQLFGRVLEQAPDDDGQRPQLGQRPARRRRACCRRAGRGPA